MVKLEFLCCALAFASALHPRRGNECAKVKNVPRGLANRLIITTNCRKSGQNVAMMKPSCHKGEGRRGLGVEVREGNGRKITLDAFARQGDGGAPRGHVVDADG